MAGQVTGKSPRIVRTQFGEAGRGLFTSYGSRERAGGVRQMLTIADEGGRGVSQKLTIADEEG